MLDGKTAVLSEQQGEGFFLAQFKTVDLSILTYYIESEGQAILIDPTLDTQAFVELATQRKAEIKALALTHYHSDFLSGHTQFKVPVLMGKHAKHPTNKFDIQELEDGSSYKLGKIELKAIHTPGHTLESTCFLLSDANDSEQALFTGDTLFVDDAGRPDLAAAPDSTLEDLLSALFESLQKIKAFKN